MEIKIIVDQNLWNKYREIIFKRLRYQQIVQYITNNLIDIKKDLLDYYAFCYISYDNLFKKIEHQILNNYLQEYNESYEWKMHDYEPIIIVKKKEG